MSFRERLNRRLSSFVVDTLPSLGYRVELRGRENLEALKDKNHLPLLVYFNHVAVDDPVVILHLLRHYLPGRENYIVLVSKTHKSSNKIPEYSKGVQMGETLGFQMPEILQTYNIRDARLSEEEKRELEAQQKELLEGLVNIIDSSIGNETVVIAPEGHRSENGCLQPTESGAGHIVKKMIRSSKKQEKFVGLVLPIGLEYEEGYTREKNWSLRHPPKIKVTVDKPIDLDEIEAGVRQLSEIHGQNINSALYTHFLMLKLRELLPQEMWGVYAYNLLEKTLKGGFELVTDKEGKVRVFDKVTQLFID